MSTISEDSAKRSLPTPSPARKPSFSQLERIGRSVGRFFSNLSYLLTALAAYCTLSFITFLFLLWKLWPNYQKAGFIAYEVATGGDPFNFTSAVGQYRFVWTWLLGLHVIAWLAVPILIGTAIDAAYRVYEARRQRTERILQKIIRKKAAEKLKLSDAELDDFVEQTMESFQQRSLEAK